MKARTFRNVVQLAGVICLVLVIGGCKKKVAATPPAPPPAPSAAQPTVTLNAIRVASGDHRGVSEIVFRNVT